MQQGLYQKYTITNNGTGDRVDGAFVLKPETDANARIALAAYAEAVRGSNPALADDLKQWLDLINP